MNLHTIVVKGLFDSSDPFRKKNGRKISMILVSGVNLKTNRDYADFAYADFDRMGTNIQSARR